MFSDDAEEVGSGGLFQAVGAVVVLHGLVEGVRPHGDIEFVHKCFCAAVRDLGGVEVFREFIDRIVDVEFPAGFLLFFDSLEDVAPESFCQFCGLAGAVFESVDIGGAWGLQWRMV